MATNIGAKIGVEGEREYRQALANINQQTKELNSEMKLLESSFDKNTTAEEKSAQKSEVLQRQIDLQKNKIELLTQQYDKQNAELERLEAAVGEATERYGENSDEANAAREAHDKYSTTVSKTKTELNKAKSELNGMNRSLEEAKNPTKEEAEALGDVSENLDKAGESGSTFGAVLKANLVSEAIIGGVKALASAFRDVAKGIADTVIDTADWADNLETLSVQTGISTERLQEMEYMAGLVDTDVSTITDSMQKLTRNMSSARNGTGDAAAAFEELGVQIVDANGNLRDSEDVFYDAIDALGKVENETERDAAAMKIFGRSARELNPLIATGSKGLAEYAQEAHEVGYVLSDEMLDPLLHTSDALERIKRAAEGTKRRIMAEFAPTIADNLERLTPMLGDLASSLADLVAPAIDVFANAVEWVKNVLDGMSDETKKTVAQVGLLAVALAPTIPLLSSLVNVGKAVGGAMAGMFSNPVIAGIGAGIAIMGALAVAENAAQASAFSAAKDIGNLTDAQYAVISSAQEAAAGLTEAYAASDEAAAALGAQRDRAMELVDMLTDLANADGVVAEADRARAQVIINELQSAYGIQIDMIDGTISGYDNLTDAVYNYINAQTAEALLDRRRDDYLAALEEEQDLLEARNLAEQDYTDKYRTWTERRVELMAWQAEHQAQLNGEAGDYARQMAERYQESLQLEVDAAWEAVSEAQQQIDNLDAAYRTGSNNIIDYEAAMAAAARGDTARVVDLLLGREHAWTNYGNTVDSVTAEALDAMYEEVLGAAEYAAEVRRNWENGVDGYTEQMVEESRKAFEDIRTEWADAYDEATGIGSDFMSGLENGLLAKKNSLLSTANGIAGAIPRQMRNVLEIYSPSRVAAEIGKFFDLGLVKGLEQGESLVGSAAEDNANTMIDAFSGTADVFGGTTAQLLTGGATSNSVNYGGVSITVHANDEQSAEQIAEAVMEQMQYAVERKGAVYA